MSNQSKIITFPVKDYSDPSALQQNRELLPPQLVSLKNVNSESGEQERKREKYSYGTVGANFNAAKPHYSLGKALAKKGECEKAIYSYRKALELDSNSAEIYQSLGDTLVKIGELDEAVIVYQKAIEIQPSLWEVHHNLGDIWQGQGRLEEAVAAYRLAIEFNPDFSWSHNNLGDVLIKQEKWEESAVAYGRAIELNPDFHWSYYNLGEALVELERWEEAVVAYRGAIQLKVDLPLVHEKLGEALQNQSRLYAKEAISFYHKAIEENPEHIRIYHKALEVNPKDPKLYLGLGNALVKQGQKDGAIVFYQMGLQLKPDDPEISLQLGKLLEGKTQPGTSPKQIVQPEIILKKVEVLDQQKDSNKGIKNSSFEGSIDTVTTYYVSGWARDKKNPDLVVVLDAFIGNSLITTCAANKYRKDLADDFQNHGCYGFHVEIPFSLMSSDLVKISIRISETGEDLAQSPATVVTGVKGKKHKIERDGSQYLLNNQLIYRPPLPFTATESLNYLSVAIIILNLNGSKLLDDLFHSFYVYNTHEAIEFLIVDHGSSDNSIEVCQTWSEKFPIKIIDRGANYSFSNSNNLAARQTEAPLLLLMNNDITLCQDIIPALIQLIVQDDEIGIVGVKLLDIVESKGFLALPPTQHLGVQLDFTGSNRVCRPFDVRYAPQLLGVNATAWRVPSVTGAVMMCRREDFLSVGGFNEEYFYGYEDMDLCLSFRQKIGKEIICANHLTALHHRGFTRFKKQTNEYNERSDKNRHILDRRFGYFARRCHLRDFFEKGFFWTSHPLRIGFAVTEAELTAGAGDYFTAMELGDELVKQFGWEVFYISKGEDWYDMNMLDAIVVMRDDYDIQKLKNAKPSLVKIAWARNWFDRWCSRKWAKDYDCFWCSCEQGLEYIATHMSQPVTLLRIASNIERFISAESDQNFQSDYCFTGSFWGHDRDISQFLHPDRIPFKFGLYGHNWEKFEQFRDSYRGALPYNELPKVYASTKIVIDDANHATKKWGSINSRVFDAIAAGALVVTNGKLGSEEVFEGLLPTYDSPESLEQVLREFLTDEPKRLERVASLQEILKNKHSYKHRAQTVFDALRDKMSLTFRISIKIGCPSWDVADEWGDYHFAMAMKRSFERKGHSVRIDILSEWETPKSYGDDVTIVLRGLSQYTPKPYHINLMWNISHPDKVSIEEYEQFDYIFVASIQYAEELQQQVTIPVQALLQCTDPDLFYPDLDGDEEASEILFVGNSRKVYRQIVRDAVEAGLAVDVFGTNWQSFLPPGYLKGEHIPNELLRRYYSRCGVLLNDHWDTMRQKGFISNRLFDAAACGAKIVSDDISGLEKVFGEQIATYNQAQELAEVVQNNLQRRTENVKDKIALAKHIREHHSFDQRVSEILKVIEKFNTEKMLNTPPEYHYTYLADIARVNVNVMAQSYFKKLGNNLHLHPPKGGMRASSVEFTNLSSEGIEYFEAELQSQNKQAKSVKFTVEIVDSSNQSILRQRSVDVIGGQRVLCRLKVTEMAPYFTVRLKTEMTNPEDSNDFGWIYWLSPRLVISKDVTQCEREYLADVNPVEVSLTNPSYFRKNERNLHLHPPKGRQGASTVEFPNLSSEKLAYFETELQSQNERAKPVKFTVQILDSANHSVIKEHFWDVSGGKTIPCRLKMAVDMPKFTLRLKTEMTNPEDSNDFGWIYWLAPCLVRYNHSK